MGDRNQVRDRSLVLRVLVPSLETRLRDKMKEAEEDAAAGKGGKSDGGTSSTTTTSNNNKEIVMDLDGVTCEPTTDGSTLWNFHCDGATYPARLVNLPCPVEIHKTHDHAMFYKAADVAQALIVYEDQMQLEESEMNTTPAGYPSYYHSGLTVPLKRVVERRFEAREHKAVAPPKSEIYNVEQELKQLIERISKDTGRSKAKKGASSQPHNKVIEEIIEDVVDYEPWMDDYGRSPNGITFDEKDVICTKHPEIWLEPDEVVKITKAATDKAADMAEAQKQKQKAKKEKKAKKKKEAAAAAAAAAAAKEDGLPGAKKGISKKNKEEVDEVTQAAAQMSSLDNNDDINFEVLDGMFTFDDDDPLKNMDMEF